MAIAYVTGNTGTSAAAPATSCATGTWSATTGNCVVVGIFGIGYPISITGVEDTAGNTYTSIGTYYDDNQYCLGLYLAQNITGNAANAVTVNLSGATTPHMVAAEFSGVSTTAAQDTGYTPAGAKTYPSPSTSNSDDTAVDNEMVVGICFCTGVGTTFSDSGGSTVRLTTTNLALATKPVATAGAATIAIAYNKDEYGHNLARALKPATATPELEEPGAGATVIAGIVPTAAQYLFQHATPNGDIADGNWLHDGGTNVNMCFHINDGSVYDDADYIRSGATPANDTYICEMTPIVTPEAGTVTLKVRARYL